MTNLDSILKSRDNHFTIKGPYNQSYGFSSSHVQMWELDRKEGWEPKNWCFRTVVLEKTLESLLDSKEIKPVNLKGNQHWTFIERTDAEATILWPPDAKSQCIRKYPDSRKDLRQEEKGTTGDEKVGWHNWCFDDIVDVSLSTLWEMRKERESWHAAFHGVTES